MSASRSKLLLCAIIAGILLAGSSGLPLPAAQERLPVTSPLEVGFTIDCKDVATVEVMIDDEVKDVISRQIFDPQCGDAETKEIKTRIYFDTFERLTKAHLTVIAFDEATRWMWLRSEDLETTREKQPMPISLTTPNPLTILEPAEGATIQGNVINVRASIQADNPYPPNFELVTAEGRVIGSAVIYVPESYRGQLYEFSVEIPINTAFLPTQARLGFQQYGSDIRGVESVTSVLLNLEP